MMGGLGKDPFLGGVPTGGQKEVQKQRKRADTVSSPLSEKQVVPKKHDDQSTSTKKVHHVAHGVVTQSSGVVEQKKVPSSPPLQENARQQQVLKELHQKSSEPPPVKDFANVVKDAILYNQELDIEENQDLKALLKALNRPQNPANPQNTQFLHALQLFRGINQNNVKQLAGVMFDMIEPLLGQKPRDDFIDTVSREIIGDEGVSSMLRDELKALGDASRIGKTEVVAKAIKSKDKDHIIVTLKKLSDDDFSKILKFIERKNPQYFQHLCKQLGIDLQGLSNLNQTLPKMTSDEAMAIEHNPKPILEPLKSLSHDLQKKFIYFLQSKIEDPNIALDFELSFDRFFKA